MWLRRGEGPKWQLGAEYKESVGRLIGIACSPVSRLPRYCSQLSREHKPAAATIGAGVPVGRPEHLFGLAREYVRTRVGCQAS
jgi:hypothetical protein